MKKFLAILMLCCASVSNAGEVYPEDFDSLRVDTFFQFYQHLDMSGLQDILDKQDRVDKCVQEYKTKRLRRGANPVQDKLYDMIYNFDQVVDKLKGLKPGKVNVSSQEKVAALAVVQCETFYSMGILK